MIFKYSTLQQMSICNIAVIWNGYEFDEMMTITEHSKLKTKFYCQCDWIIRRLKMWITAEHVEVYRKQEINNYIKMENLGRPWYRCDKFWNWSWKEVWIANILPMAWQHYGSGDGFWTSMKAGTTSRWRRGHINAHRANRVCLNQTPRHSFFFRRATVRCWCSRGLNRWTTEIGINLIMAQQNTDFNNGCILAISAAVYGVEYFYDNGKKYCKCCWYCSVQQRTNTKSSFKTHFDKIGHHTSTFGDQ